MSVRRVVAATFESGEMVSPVTEGSTMSYVTGATSTRTAKVARLTEALRQSWTQARLTDRELIALRTSLTRHVG